SPAPFFEPPPAPADSAPTPWSDPAPIAAAETAFAWDSPPSAPAGEAAPCSAAPAEAAPAWSAAPVAVPAAPEVGSWDQMTAANVPAPALIPPPPTGWEAPAHAATEVVATEDVIWSAPPPAEPAEDWKAE